MTLKKDMASMPTFSRYRSIALLWGFLIAMLCAPVGNALAAPICNGKFFNPITDICWECLMPFTIGSTNVMEMGQEGVSTYSGIPTCACSNPIRAGAVTGFYEPARIVEISRNGFCFPSLGGVRIDPGIDVQNHSQATGRNGTPNHSFYHAHWYTAPLLFWLEVLLDDFCLEQGVLDLAFITEADPTWDDSEWSFLLSPDVVLFANPEAQGACAADCVMASSGFGSNTLYWCAGCAGPMFPLTGWVNAHVGGIQASSLIAQRMTNKMHRMGTVWAGSGNNGVCGFYPQPLMDKLNYKYQLTYPVPQTDLISGHCCQPFGRSSVLWGAGKEIPFVGNDFAYQIFRKRDCCASFLQPL